MTLSKISIGSGIKAVSLLVVLVIALCATACTTLADVRAAKGSGTVRTFDMSYEKVWQTVLDVVQANRLAVASANLNEGIVIAQGRPGAFSYGENLMITVEGIDGKVRARVEIVSKPVVTINITATDWEKKLMAEISQRLSQTAD